MKNNLLETAFVCRACLKNGKSYEFKEEPSATVMGRFIKSGKKISCARTSLEGIPLDVEQLRRVGFIKSTRHIYKDTDGHVLHVTEDGRRVKMINFGGGFVRFPDYRDMTVGELIAAGALCGIDLDYKV